MSWTAEPVKCDASTFERVQVGRIQVVWVDVPGELPDSVKRELEAYYQQRSDDMADVVG